MKKTQYSTLVMQLRMALCLLPIAVAQASTRIEQPLTPEQVFTKVEASIVTVKTEVAQGTGVKLPSGRIVTNFHVVEKGTHILVGQGGHFFPASIYATEAEKDLCLLEAPDLKIPSITLGNTSTLTVGAAVCAVGSPQGLELFMSNGVVSQLRGEAPPSILTTAAISPGVSGGGLFDSQANLVGITTFKGRGGENLSFALPVEWIQQLVSPKPKPAHNTEGSRTLGGWMTYQTEMDQAVEQLKILMGDRRVTPHEKLAALEQAKLKWADKNPYSDKGERSRAWIQEQCTDLRIRQSKAVAKQAKETLNAEGFTSWRAEEFGNLSPLLAGSEKAKSYLAWLKTGVSPVVSGIPQTPGALLKEEVSGMDFVWIPAGSLTMGSGRPRSFGKPQHDAIISHGFWMGKFEVTQDQYEAVMGVNPSLFKTNGPDAPVEQVSWNDAQDFIQKLNEQTGELHFRLPTEAEWEFACKAGKTHSAPDPSAWFNTNSGNSTHPVGQKAPNGWGLYDMLGNVWEWCQDSWGDYSTETVTDPKGPSGSPTTNRILRGGAWEEPPRYCHPTYRYSGKPELRSSKVGFRLVAFLDVP